MAVQWCIKRSMIAVAAIGSPKTSPHSAIGRLVVMIVLFVSYLQLIIWNNRCGASGENGTYPSSSMISNLGLEKIVSLSAAVWSWTARKGLDLSNLSVCGGGGKQMTARLLKDEIINDFFWTFPVNFSCVEEGSEMSARGCLMLSANTNVQPHCLAVLVASGRQASKIWNCYFFLHFTKHSESGSVNGSGTTSFTTKWFRNGSVASFFWGGCAVSFVFKAK